MPRDGSQIYHRPPGTDGIPDTTIESTKYNINVADVEQDLNLPRPIIAGGTGATNALDARTALGADTASLSQVVTNYDSQVFQSGSFSSFAGATAAPTAPNHFTGICQLLTGDGAYIVITATEVGTGDVYQRRKQNGVWATWSKLGGSQTANDAAYVNVAGDTMTGNLIITPQPNGGLFVNTTNYGGITLNNTDNTTSCTVTYMHNGKARWIMQCPTPGESGSNVGGNYSLNRYDDNGNYLGEALGIRRSDGYTTISGNTTVSGNVNCSTVTATNSMVAHADQFNNSLLCLARPGGTNSALQFMDNAFGTWNYLTGSAAALNYYAPAHSFNDMAGNPTAVVAASGVRFTATTFRSDTQTGPVFNLNGMYDGLNINNAQSDCRCSISASSGAYLASIILNPGEFTFYSNTSQPWGVAFPNIGGVIQCRADNVFTCYNYAQKPGGGAWGDSSDIRIKNVLGDYTSGLDEILALHPKLFTFKGNDTHDPPSNVMSGDTGEPDKTAPTTPYKNSGHYSVAKASKQFIGLIAQEADPVMPEMVSNHDGYIDGEKTEILDLDTTPLVYALINAVKTLAARVEQLEARQPARR